MSALIGSKLIFLTDLPTSQPGDKVRFLGCVLAYDSTSGILTLEHAYKDSKHQAYLRIEHVREMLKGLVIKDGSWVNVVGYVNSQGDGFTDVGATMLWEAGPLKIDEYDRALEARLAAEALGKK